jgi:predicted ATPase
VSRPSPRWSRGHYDQAGLAAPAITHYQAGERAAERSANEEAIGHLRRALALVGTLPETRERHQRELGLQMAIGAPLAAARGWSHPEYAETSARARAGVSDRRVARAASSARGSGDRSFRQR